MKLQPERQRRTESIVGALYSHADRAALDEEHEGREDADEEDAENHAENQAHVQFGVYREAK